MTEREKELQAELDKYKRMLKDICEEWNEDCNPTCDSHGHDEDCKRVNIAAAKKSMQAELDAAKAKIAELTAKSEPVAKIHRNSAGQVYIQDMNGNHFNVTKYIGATLYITPQVPEWLKLVSTEHLGKEFEKVLYDNLDELYEGVDVAPKEK